MVVLGRPGSFWERPRSFLGSSSEPSVERPGNFLGRPGASWGRPGSRLELLRASWAWELPLVVLGASRSRPGSYLEVLGASWTLPGVVPGPPGIVLELLGAFWELPEVVWLKLMRMFLFSLVHFSQFFFIAGS